MDGGGDDDDDGTPSEEALSLSRSNNTVSRSMAFIMRTRRIAPKQIEPETENIEAREGWRGGVWRGEGREGGEMKMKMKGPPQRLTGYGIPLSVKLNGFCVVFFFPLCLSYLPEGGGGGLKRDLLGASGEGEARSRLLLILGEIP